MTLEKSNNILKDIILHYSYIVSQQYDYYELYTLENWRVINAEVDFDVYWF